jgi:nitroreductase
MADAGTDDAAAVPRLEARPVLAALHARRSCREFAPENVPDEVVREMVDAARVAPSGGDLELRRFVAVGSRETLAVMRQAVEGRIAEVRSRLRSPRAVRQFDGYTAHFTHFERAPVVIAVLARPYDSIYTRILARHLGPEDRPAQELVDVAAMTAAAAIENMLVAATALGYGACFMTGPMVAQAEIEKALSVEPPWHVVALVPVGRPAGEPGPRRRAGTEEVLAFA